jgi:hypothetical protein
MAQVLSTDKVLDSRIKRGELFEKKVSLHFHNQGIPVLCSSLILRTREMGQCDLIRYFPVTHFLEIWELKKSSQISQAFTNQERRLRLSVSFLSQMLKAKGSLKLITEEDFAKTHKLH